MVEGGLVFPVINLRKSLCIDFLFSARGLFQRIIILWISSVSGMTWE